MFEEEGKDSVIGWGWVSLPTSSTSLHFALKDLVDREPERVAFVAPKLKHKRRPAAVAAGPRSH